MKRVWADKSASYEAQELEFNPHHTHTQNQAWSVPIIPVLGRWRQEDSGGLQASLSS